MDTRRSERLAGGLFILATVSTALGFMMLDPVLAKADVLASVAEDETAVMVGALLVLINAIAVVAIPVLLYPTFKRYNPPLARLYPASRIVESVVLVIGVVGLLGLVTLSRTHVEGVADAASYQASAAALVAVYDWGVLLGIMLFFALAGLLLNYLLYQGRLVPRWLAVWGLVGVALLLIEGSFEAFDVDNLEVLSLPFAVQEMVFAVWLIVKGLREPAGALDASSAADRSEVLARSST